MNAPLDPSISDLLRGSSLAPMMDEPVSHILRGMGLPQLPVIPPLPPLPGLPPLPTIDLASLVRPLTDMAAAFGTGQFGGSPVHPAVAAQPNGTTASPAAASPNVDPTQVLSAITTGLETCMQLGMSAMQVVMQLWQGQGATEAASTGTQAGATGSALATQSTGQKGILGEGAFSVFTGAGLMTGVLDKYLAEAAAAAPACAAPGGAGFLVAATVDAISEALAVLAKTEAELLVHSANMVEAGQKVPVSSVPTGVDPASQVATAADAASTSGSGELQQLMQLISPAVQMLSTGVQSAMQLGQSAVQIGETAAKALVPGASTAATGTPIAAATSGGIPPGSSALGAYKGAGSSVSGGGGGVAGISRTPATQLTPYVGTQLAGNSAKPDGAGTSEADTAEEVSTSTPMSTTSPGVMPMSSAGSALAAAKSADGDTHSNLVTSSNGDAVVGDIAGATLPVVGGTARAVDAPPDKELTL